LIKRIVVIIINIGRIIDPKNKMTFRIW